MKARNPLGPVLLARRALKRYKRNPMTLSAGACFGPYEILSPLGAGGMGEVFLARDTKLNRDVAIKVLPATFAQDPARVARFRREAQLLASLNHPNIAAIHGLEESEGVVALALELVEGEDLAERLKRAAIPVEEAIPIASRPRKGSRPRTRRASSIATSNRRTSRSPRTARSRSSTSVWRRPTGEKRKPREAMVSLSRRRCRVR
jgi:hypothetical protein